ncbi:MAG: aspartate aminotransferase family protein [Bacteroidetes bacterium]|nr:aspartate aminotransferase family protein [Bacteroidota bacterium]
MLTNRQLFFQHIALPSTTPLCLEIVKAESIYLFDNEGRRYVDLVSGVAVNNVGHRHPKVVKAITEQLEKYMHLMVYGEYIQSPQVRLAELLNRQLPESLNSVYFVNSGSEAIEGALKLAKRCTGRSEIFSFKNAYHGSTHGALSVLGNEDMKNAFRPLLPDVHMLEFNDINGLKRITEKTACVLVEPIQAEAGIILPKDNFLQKLTKRCRETGSLLIFDEVQMGFARTGKLFSFEHFNIVPDILCLAKGMGGGMPIGAFIASKEMMMSFTNNPALGHITTFGGHPVCAAASLANLNVILDDGLIKESTRKGNLFKAYLSNIPSIIEIRGKGLMLAVDLGNTVLNNKIVDLLLEQGVIVDRFLFNSNAFRIAPPLIITDEQIKDISDIIRECIETANK